MRPKVIIQTIDDLYIDQFSNCILVDFSYEIEETRDVFFPQQGGAADVLPIGNSACGKIAIPDTHFLCVDYEPPHLKFSQRIKIAA